MPIKSNQTLGGFDVPPRKDSFAAKVARSDNPDASVDVSELSEKEQAQLRKASEIDKAAAGFKFTPPEQAEERVEIIFDNSGSMAGEAIKNAQEGVTEFMKACIPNQTAIRVTPVDSARADALRFTCDLPAIAARVGEMRAAGGTPLYSKLQNALGKGSRSDLYPSRIIAFSDGAAGDGWARRESYRYYDDPTPAKMEDSPAHIEVVALAKERKVAIDTCFIYDGGGDPTQDSGYKTMKALADDTGGIFILFEKGKCDFKRGFKYLTKGSRLLLMDSNFKAKLEAGQI
jgi:Mg-chelatase subunit ChlD